MTTKNEPGKTYLMQGNEAIVRGALEGGVEHEDIVPDKDDMALSLSDSAVVIPPLVPWSIAGAVPLAGAGAPTSSILASFYLFLLPLTRVIGSLIRKKRERSIAK